MRRSPGGTAYPCHRGNWDLKILCNLSHTQGDGEEVKSVPRPAQKAAEKEQPLVACDILQHRIGIL